MIEIKVKKGDVTIVTSEQHLAFTTTDLMFAIAACAKALEEAWEDRGMPQKLQVALEGVRKSISEFASSVKRKGTPS